MGRQEALQVVCTMLTYPTVRIALSVRDEALQILKALAKGPACVIVRVSEDVDSYLEDCLYCDTCDIDMLESELVQADDGDYICPQGHPLLTE